MPAGKGLCSKHMQGQVELQLPQQIEAWKWKLTKDPGPSFPACVLSWHGGTALNFDSGQEGAAGEGELSVPLNEETVKIEIKDGLFFFF